MIRTFRALVFAAAVSFVTLPASGQFNFNLGGEIARPTSGLARLVEKKYGYGGHVALTYWFGYRYQLIASGAFVTYGSEAFGVLTGQGFYADKNLDGVLDPIEGDYSSLPITLGLRYYPLKRVFVQGSAGVVYKRTRLKGTADRHGKADYGTKRDLIVSPGVGLLMGRFSLQAQYNLAQDDWKWFSLGLSMIFGKL